MQSDSRQEVSLKWLGNSEFRSVRFHLLHKEMKVAGCASTCCNPTLKPKQEVYFKFKASLDHTFKTRPARDKSQDCFQNGGRGSFNKDRSQFSMGKSKSVDFLTLIHLYFHFCSSTLVYSFSISQIVLAPLSTDFPFPKVWVILQTVHISFCAATVFKRSLAL